MPCAHAHAAQHRSRNSHSPRLRAVTGRLRQLPLAALQDEPPGGELCQQQAQAVQIRCKGASLSQQLLRGCRQGGRAHAQAVCTLPTSRAASQCSQVQTAAKCPGMICSMLPSPTAPALHRPAPASPTHALTCVQAAPARHRVGGVVHHDGQPQIRQGRPAVLGQQHVGGPAGGGRPAAPRT